MPMLKQLVDESRAHYLMRVAAVYIRAHCHYGLIGYDGAWCDGMCLASELDAERENPSNESE